MYSKGFYCISIPANILQTPNGFLASLLHNILV